jgi:hypothetical protein
MTKKEVREKIKAFKNAGFLKSFTDDQIKALVKLYEAEQKLLLKRFTEDEKFLFRVHDFKKFMIK